MSSQLSSESLKESLERCFGDIPDNRVIGKTAHKLIDIISVSLLAVVCGADSRVGIETTCGQVLCGRAKQTWLKTFLELPNGIPSHDTFARVIRKLNPET